MSSLHHQLAELSGLIYEDWDVVRERLDARPTQYMIGEPFDVSGSQGMLVMGKTNKSSLFATIIFRGTEASDMDLKDIWSNVGFPVGWEGRGKVHSGYTRHFSNIRDQARALAEHIPSPIPLYITGHSLGGALATLYAAWVGSGTSSDHNIAGLVTFGAPKAMNEEAIQGIACKTARYTNRYDFAPWWPPIPGLTHPEPRVRVNSGGWPGPVSRHGIGKYMRAVR